MCIWNFLSAILFLLGHTPFIRPLHTSSAYTYRVLITLLMNSPNIYQTCKMLLAPVNHQDKSSWGDFSCHLQNMPTHDENLLKNNHNTYIQGSLQGASLNGHTGSHVASPFLGSSCCHCFQNWLRWQYHTKNCSHHTACTCIVIVWLVTDNGKGGGIGNAYWTLYWRHRIFAMAMLIHIHDKCNLASFLNTTLDKSAAFIGGLRYVPYQHN